MLTNLELTNLSNVLNYFAKKYSHQIANLNAIIDYGIKNRNFTLIRIFYQLSDQKIIATSQNAHAYYNDKQSNGLNNLVTSFENKFLNQRLLFDAQKLSFNAIPLNYKQLATIINENLNKLQTENTNMNNEYVKY